MSVKAATSDLYEATGRRPNASINFITARDGDGFALRDLVSYNDKHNEVNGENNCDGESHNRSWNCGVEGPTDDPAVHALRARQQRNFLATLFLSQEVPMLLGGDEIAWYTLKGDEMAEEHWGEGFAKSLGMFLNGEGIASMSPRGERVVDDTFYVLLNAHYEALSFTLPGREWDWRWVKALDTNAPLPAESDQIVEAGKEILVEAQSLVVLRQEE